MASLFNLFHGILTLNLLSQSFLRLQFGFNRVDECTKSLDRALFARVCMELDLLKPLKRGFWLEDEETKIFVVYLSKKLPIFFNIVVWLVGHEINSCDFRPRVSVSDVPFGSPSKWWWSERVD